MKTSQRRVFCVAAFPTHPCNRGNRSRLLNLLDALQTEGHAVHYAWLADPQTNHAESLEQMQMYWKGGVSVIPFQLQNCRRTSGPDSWYDESVTPLLKAALDEFHPDVLWVEYAYLSKAFESAGRGQIKILDTHDALTGRDSMLKNQGIVSSYPVPSFHNPAHEAEALDRADVVVSIQEKETAFFRGLCSSKVTTIGHLLKVAPAHTTCSEKPRLLFVGSDSLVAAANIQNFLSKVYPVIRKRLPQAELYIAGCVNGHLKHLPPGCRTLGYVEDLSGLSAMCDIAVSFEVSGTGLSIKNFSALANGLALVTNALGARGIHSSDAAHFLMVETPEEYADQIEALVRSPDKYAATCRAAHAFAQAAYETNKKRLLGILS